MENVMFIELSKNELSCMWEEYANYGSGNSFTRVICSSDGSCKNAMVRGFNRENLVRLYEGDYIVDVVVRNYNKFTISISRVDKINKYSKVCFVTNVAHKENVDYIPKDIVQSVYYNTVLVATRKGTDNLREVI